MGFLSKYFSSRATVQPLPAGTITVDRQGQIVTSTVSSSYPKPLLVGVARDVLELFREARATQMPLAEISLQFGSLRITARELRGGVIIFLFPQSAHSAAPTLSTP